MISKSIIFGLLLVIGLAAANEPEKVSEIDDIEVPLDQLSADDEVKNRFGGFLDKLKEKVAEAGHKFLNGTREIVDKVITEKEKILDKLVPKDKHHDKDHDKSEESHGNNEHHGDYDQSHEHHEQGNNNGHQNENHGNSGGWNNPNEDDHQQKECDPISGVNCLDVRFED